MTVTGFIAYAQGWGGLYIRANKLAWRQVQQPSRPGDQQPFRHPRLPGAGPLGAGVCPDGRRAGRLRLRPRALLLADASSDQLDGRRRLPARGHPARSAGTIRKATCCSSTARWSGNSRRRAAIWSRSSSPHTTRTANSRCWAQALWNCRADRAYEAWAARYKRRRYRHKLEALSDHI